MAGRRTLGVLALALVAASSLISSCGGASSTSGGGSAAHAAPPPVGKSVRLRAGETMLVVAVQRVTFPLRGSGALLAPGDRAAGVELAVRNVGQGAYDSSSESDVSLRTSSGASAEPAFASEGACATTEIDFLKEVQPGESRSGCVAFDLPKGAKPVAVRFSPEGLQGLARTWRVKA